LAIPQSQLEVWAKQGAAIVGSRDTYATIRRALEVPGSGYSGKSYKIFLQGSYGNDTNIWAESDVDVVIRLDSIYHYDTSALNQVHLAQFNAALIPGTYPYLDYKNDVKTALVKAFGASDIVDGSKAITIKAKGNRRSADVIVATLFRRYYSGTYSLMADSGICFFDSKGNRIANYPDQHSANCTQKHQATFSRFKPLVRVFKNMRSRLVNAGTIADGIAPSYYIEGLLYNVPNEKFQNSPVDTFVDTVNWILQANRAAFWCPNNQYPLFGDTAVQWPAANYDVFMKALITLWNDWS